MRPQRYQPQLSFPRRLAVGLRPVWRPFHALLQFAKNWRLPVGARWSRLDVEEVVRYFWKPFTLFRLCRVPVQFHATFLIYPAGFFVWACYVKDSVPGLLRAIVFLIVFCCSLMVHEFAHVFTARHWGIGSRRVILIPLGAVAELESLPGVPGEIWIALAGPLASFALVGMFWIALHAMVPSLRYWLSGRYWLLEARHVSRFGCGLNLMVALFNLLPCFPMDGGRVLRGGLAFFIRRVFPQHAGQASLIATGIAVRYVAWPVALGMMAWTIVHTQDWLDLVLFPLLVLLAEAEYYLIRTDNGPTGGDDQ